MNMNRSMFLVALAFLSVLPVVLSQQEGSANSESATKNTDTSKKKNTSALNSSAVADALKKDEFTLTSGKDGKGEYKLDKPIDLTADQSAQKSVSVDYQVGTIDKKPALATIVVDPKAASKSPADVDGLLRDLPKEQPAQTSGSTTVMQKCSDGEVCVKTEMVDGKPVCVEWRCK